MKKFESTCKLKPTKWNIFLEKLCLSIILFEWEQSLHCFSILYALDVCKSRSLGVFKKLKLG